MRITFERKPVDITELNVMEHTTWTDTCEVHLNGRRVPEHLEKAILYLADTKGEDFVYKVFQDVYQIEKEC